MQYFGGPVWITHYDKDVVPCYQFSENGKTSNADLLMSIERFLLFILEKHDIRDIQVFRRFNDGRDIV